MGKIKKGLSKIKLFNLNKYYPQYFNKKIFQIILFLVIILTVYLMIKHNLDFSTKYYQKCLSNICPNDYYLCTREVLPSNECREILKTKCIGDLCNKPFVHKNQVIGYKDELIENFDLIVIFLFFIGIITSYGVDKFDKNKINTKKRNR